MTNYYHLTKNELSFISNIQAPYISTSGVRLSRPVVVALLGDEVVFVWSLKWFRHCVKVSLIDPTFKYVIRSML